MTPYEYYSLAQWLCTNRPTADGYRSAVSRAYYSALHHGLVLLAEMGIVVPARENKHEKVPDILQHTADTAVCDAGYKLGLLRGERNRADYKLDDRDAESKNFAELRLTEAESIITTLNGCKLSKGTPGGRFETAMNQAKKRAALLFLGKG